MTSEGFEICPEHTKRVNEDVTSPQAPRICERNGTAYDFNIEPHWILPCIPSGPESLLLLHVYLGGTGSKPTGNFKAHGFISTNPPSSSDLCIHVITLSYIWGNFADAERNAIISALPAEEQQGALASYHNAICFGGRCDVEKLLDPIDSEDAIEGRLTSLLIYLRNTRPAHEQWEVFLDPTGTQPNYSRIILSGHSQGSGHACYIAKYRPLYRAIFISGPQEHLTEVGTTTHSWIDQCHTTSLSSPSRQFETFSTKSLRAFMHAEEEGTAALIRKNFLHVPGLIERNECENPGKSLVNESVKGEEDSLVSARIHMLDICDIWPDEFADLPCSCPPLNDNPPLSRDKTLSNTSNIYVTRIMPSNHSIGRPKHNSTAPDIATPRKTDGSFAYKKIWLHLLTK